MAPGGKHGNHRFLPRVKFHPAQKEGQNSVPRLSEIKRLRIPDAQAPQKIASPRRPRKGRGLLRHDGDGGGGENFFGGREIILTHHTV